jgi:CubicO group peptidase (beta-lactamase class C family)
MRHVILLAGWLFALAAPLSADGIDDYVRAQLSPRHIPGLSLVVVRHGQVVKVAAYGLASLELQAPASLDTVYEIGSISKQFTAEAVMLLVEDGKLALDDLLSKHLDGTPPAWSAITLRHVLTHTAGLGDFDTGNIGFSYRREYTAAEFIDLLAKKPLDFEPGTRWNYNNSFALLGPVIARASGMSYEAFVTSRIFTKLGLTSARFKNSVDVVPHRADGHLWREPAYTHGEALRPAFIAPNGGIMMNIADFATWDIALGQGRLLSAASWNEMRTPARLRDGRTVGHGLAWFMDAFNGHRFMAHWGSTVAGYSAVVRRYVDDGVSVLLLANVDDGAAGVDAIARRVADMFVKGAAIQGLSPIAQPDAVDTARIRASIISLAGGADDSGAVPGLAARFNPALRARLGAALSRATAFDALGGETIGEQHFMLDPSIASVRWYRLATPQGPVFLTVHLTREGRVARVGIEEEAK